MVNLGVRRPEHRASRRAGAVSLVLHGAVVALVIVEDEPFEPRGPR